MPETPGSLEEAIAKIVDFRDKRDWAQYHTPEHLSRALSIEASELEEEFLWKGPDEIEDYLRTNEGRRAVKFEIGDVLIYALLFCERLGIDPLKAITRKLEKNQEKFPAREVRGEPTLDIDGTEEDSANDAPPIDKGSKWSDGDGTDFVVRNIYIDADGVVQVQIREEEGRSLTVTAEDLRRRAHAGEIRRLE